MEQSTNNSTQHHHSSAQHHSSTSHYHAPTPHHHDNVEQHIHAIVMKTAIFCVIAGIILGLTGGILGSIATQSLMNSNNGSALLKNITNTTSTEVVDEESAVIAVAEKADPAVVSIIVSKDLPQIRELPLGPFGVYRIQEQNGTGTEKTQIGGGSGFIVSSEGHIITNKHVVSDPNAEYTVLTNDEQEYHATVLATDPVLDIAILKIEADKELSTLSLGDSDSIKVGQHVIAIGNALGEFQNTVSTGVVSGLHRSITASDMNHTQAQRMNGIIQTDAAINQGNSGGPLLDINGNVIGMNSANAQNGENIGFAIPINDIKRDLEQVLDHNKITLPFIGIRYTTIDKSVAEHQHLSVDHGALIVNGQTQDEPAIAPNSPAAKVNLQEHDIITEIDGEELTEKQELATVLRNKNPGDTITLTVIRDNETQNIDVTLEERPQS